MKATEIRSLSAHYMDNMLKCDKCKKTFPVRDIELKPFGGNFSAPLAMFMYVDVSDMHLVRGSPKEMDYVLACPFCGEVHLSGFDDAPKKKR